MSFLIIGALFLLSADKETDVLEMLQRRIIPLVRNLPTLRAIQFAFLCFALLQAQPSEAQFRFPRPNYGMPQRPQVQQQDICAEYGAFGYVNRLIEMHISCWQRKFRTGKLSTEPFHPSLVFTAPSFSSGSDIYGLTQREWLELPDAALLGRFLAPDRLNVVLQNFRAGDLKAAVIFYMAGQLANEPFLFGPKPSPIIKAFGAAYPACKDADLFTAAGGDCASGFASLRRRLQAAGIGQAILHGGQKQDWNLYAIALSRSDAARSFPRALWLASVAQPDSGPFSRQDAENLVDAYNGGVLPAVERVQKLGNTCSGNRDVVSVMSNRGVTLQAVTEKAVQLGNAEAAMQFAGFSREGTCGVPADRKLAFRFMLNAAQMGHVPAMREVSNLYARGEGVAENPREAINWARKAGDGDSPYLASLQKRVGAHNARLAREGVINDVADKPLNIATVRAVLLREMRWLYENSDFGIQSSLSTMFGVQTEWDEESGTVSMNRIDNVGRDWANLSMRSTQSLSVTGVACTPSGGGYSCRYTVSVYMDTALGRLKLADNVTTRPSLITDLFVFQSGQWRSQTARTRMLSGLRAAPVRSGPNAGMSSLCKSLYAGVVAAGGRSTSSGLDPSTWNC